MDFKTQFIKKFSKSRWERFDAAIRLMISHAVKAPDRQILEYTGDMVSNSTIRPHLNNADYCQAFGMVQGVAYYALNHDTLGACNIVGTPRHYIDSIEKEYGDAEYAALTNKKTA